VKPTLLAIDFRNLTVRRYWPKPGDRHPVAFITQTGQLQKRAEDPWKLGNYEGRAMLEDFRLGKLEVQQDTDNEKEYA
jgi:hypothetical protein